MNTSLEQTAIGNDSKPVYGITPHDISVHNGSPLGKGACNHGVTLVFTPRQATPSFARDAAARVVERINKQQNGAHGIRDASRKAVHAELCRVKDELIGRLSDTAGALVDELVALDSELAACMGS